MPLSNNQIEKIYKLRKKLQLIYKSARSDEQRKRIYKNLNHLEEIIKDLEDGKEINPEELNIFSDDLKNEKKEKIKVDNRISYIAIIEISKLSEIIRDSEMDQFYSFLTYFEKNFAIPLGANYLKLEFTISKMRDNFISHYDAIKLLLKEYREDINLLETINNKEKLEHYKHRLDQQKNYFLIKLSELLTVLKELLDKIINDFYSGRNSIFNPDEIYIDKYARGGNKSDFENRSMLDIVKEAQYFTQDFIEILRMPDFKNT